MKNFNSLKKNKEFQAVYKAGKSYANKYLVMYVMKNGQEQSRIGISVSKKVGNSVVRHHITRVLREIFRLNESHIKTGLDIIVVARASAKEESYTTIESAYMHLCGLHNLVSPSSPWLSDRKKESK